MQRIGPYLQTLRGRQRITLEELAAYLMITPSLLNRIEKGQLHASKHQVFQLASYFGVEAKEMLLLFQQDRILAEMKDKTTLEEGCISSTLTSSLMHLTGLHIKRHANMMRELSLLRESQLQINTYKPPYPLNLYMESMVYYHGKHLPYERILPDGAVQLIITLNEHERFLMTNAEKTSDRILQKAWITGVQKQSLTYRLTHHENTLYIRFHPGGFYALTRIPPSAMNHSTMSAELVLGPSILQLREALCSSKDTNDMFQKIERYFSHALSPPETAHAVISYMCQHWKMPLPFLVRKTGYSQKHLIHLFKKYVGITPKYYQRIGRFNEVLNHLQTRPGKVDWSSVVFDHHYYDQAHFIKEFHHFTGLSPQAYLETGTTCSKFMHSQHPW